MKCFGKLGPGWRIYFRTRQQLVLLAIRQDSDKNIQLPKSNQYLIHSEHAKTDCTFYFIGMYAKHITSSISYLTTKYLSYQKTKTLRPAIILVLKTSFEKQL